MVEIDVARLPATLLLDTGVLIRALGHRPDDEHAPACAALFDAALAANRRILIAAPTVTEIERGRPTAVAAPRPVPAIRNVVVVAFDHAAAREAAGLLPAGSLSELAVSGLSRTYLKYDVLVLACAVRWKADVIVTLDGKMRERYAARTTLRFALPGDFSAPQSALPFGARPRKPPGEEPT